MKITEISTKYNYFNVSFSVYLFISFTWYHKFMAKENDGLNNLNIILYIGDDKFSIWFFWKIQTTKHIKYIWLLIYTEWEEYCGVTKSAY